MKKILFWTAVAILPCGFVLLAYKGIQNEKVRAFVDRQLARFKRK